MDEHLLILLKIVISILCGYLIGKERKRHDKSAGSRTMSLICLGACVVSIMSLKISINHSCNFMRLMAYTIAGISFIGNGVIIKKRNNVDGLTTSATLLVSVILGFCIGLGYYFLSLVSITSIYLILESKYWILKKRKA